MDRVQAKVCAILAQLDPNPANKQQAEEALRRELYQIVDTDLAKLRPAKGSATFASSDWRFVLVLAANNTTGANGYNAEAQDDKDLIVIAVAGDGGPGQGKELRSGSGGLARAAAGVAGEMAPSAESAWAATAARPLGGEGGCGGGRDIQNPAAIVQALKKLQKP